MNIQVKQDAEQGLRNGGWQRLLIIIILVVAVQALGGLATASSVKSWYPTLEKAAWNPPAFVFGPVWTALYLLMIWAGWRVWQRLHGMGVARPWAHPALRAFAIQLMLNLGWSLLFFGLRQPAIALVEMVFLFAAMVWMYRAFLTVDRVAAYSQIPYLLWVAFAFTLNAAIVGLN